MVIFYFYLFTIFDFIIIVFGLFLSLLTKILYTKNRNNTSF